MKLVPIKITLKWSTASLLRDFSVRILNFCSEQFELISKRTNQKTMILKILPFLLTFGTVGFIIYMGFHNPVIVQEVNLPPRVAVYYQYKGSYDETCSAIEKLNEFYERLNITDALKFGFFYDNPSNLSDPNQARAVFGILADFAHRKELVHFAANNIDLSYSEIRRQDNSLSVTYPWRNFLSSYWVVYQIYPTLTEYALTHNTHDLGETVGTLEIYTEDTIQVILPRGPHVTDFLLSAYKASRQFTPETPTREIPEGEKKVEL